MELINEHVLEVVKRKANNNDVKTIWKDLCKDYTHEKENRYPSMFFRTSLEYQCALHYTNVADPEDPNFFNSFNTTISNKFNPEHVLSQRLIALMTYFPESVGLLSEEIRNTFKILPWTPFSQKGLHTYFNTLITKLNPRVMKGYVSGYDRYTREAAARLLGELLPIVPLELYSPITNALITRLQDTQAIVRKAAIETLAIYSRVISTEEEKIYLSEKLIESLVNPNNTEEVKQAAGDAIVKQFDVLSVIQQQKNIDQLFAYSENQNPILRKIALNALCDLYSKLDGIKQKRLIAQLSCNLLSENHALREAVVKKLNQLSPALVAEEWEQILNPLVSQLADNDIQARSIAAEILGCFPHSFDNASEQKQQKVLSALLKAFFINLEQSAKLADNSLEESRLATATTAKTLGHFAQLFHVLPQAEIQGFLLALFENLRNTNQNLNKAGPIVLSQLTEHFAVLDKDQKKIALTDLAKTIKNPSQPEDALAAAEIMYTVIPYAPERKKALVNALNELCTEKRASTRQAATMVLVKLYNATPQHDAFFALILGKLDDYAAAQETVVRHLSKDAIAYKPDFIKKFVEVLEQATTSTTNKLIIAERLLSDLSEFCTEESKILAIKIIEEQTREKALESKTAIIETLARLLPTKQESLIELTLIDLLVSQIDEDPAALIALKKCVTAYDDNERADFFKKLFPALFSYLKNHPQLSTSEKVGELITSCLTHMDSEQKTIHIESQLLCAYQETSDAKYASALENIILMTSAERIKTSPFNTPVIDSDLEQKSDLSNNNRAFA